jgi:hypothetical protein
MSVMARSPGRGATRPAPVPRSASPTELQRKGRTAMLRGRRRLTTLAEVMAVASVLAQAAESVWMPSGEWTVWPLK